MSENLNQIIFEALQPNELEKLLAGYTVIRLIETGGMGAVYLGEQTSLERKVAIKVLPEEFGKNKNFRNLFQTEAKTMAKISHPNLIAVYDFGNINGMLFLIMEYADGGSLHELAHTEKLEEFEITKIVSQIANGLASAHNEGILHRDIKPSNILLTKQRDCKISDFGLARPAEETETGTIFGTPGYTAPEVINKPEAVDIRADIYSVGVLLYELLTGKLPSKNYVTAQSLVDSDPRFDKIIRKALHRSPAMRYKSASDLADALIELYTDLNPNQEAGKFDVNTPSKLLTSNDSSNPSLLKTGSTPKLNTSGQQLRTQSNAHTIRKSTADVTLRAGEKATDRVSIRVNTTGNVNQRASNIAQNSTPILVNTVTNSHPVTTKHSSPQNNVAPSDSNYIRQTSPTSANNKSPKKLVFIGIATALFIILVALVSINKKDKKQTDSTTSNDEVTNSTPQQNNPIINNSAPDEKIEEAAKIKLSYDEVTQQLALKRGALLAGVITSTNLPTNTIQRRNKFFAFINKKMTWHQADQYAQKYGGSLVTLSTIADGEFLAENSDFEDDFWIGGGATPEGAFSLLNGNSSQIAKRSTKGKFSSFNKGKTRGQHYANTLFPFYIQWNKNNYTFTDSNSRLIRAFTNESNDDSQYPPGSTGTNARNYYLVKGDYTFQQASDLAEMSGGSLAIVSSDNEKRIIYNIINNAILPEESVWLGTYTNKNSLFFNTTIESNIYNDFKKKFTQTNAGITLTNKDNAIDWEFQNVLEKANYFLVEWSNDKASAHTDGFQLGQVSNQNELNKKLNIKLQRESKFYEREKAINLKRIYWIIDTWLKNITPEQRQTSKLKLESIKNKLSKSKNLKQGLSINKLPEKLKKQLRIAIYADDITENKHKKAKRTFMEIYEANLKKLIAREHNENSANYKKLQGALNTHRKRMNNLN